MTIRRSRIVATAGLIASAVLLVGVTISWATSGNAEPRADLQGAPVTDARPTSGAVPTTAARSTVATPTTTAAPSVPIGIPARITIASLGVDAPIDPVGLERNGSMEVPGATETGWYRYGPRPGSDAGSAVIAAHVDFNGVRGVFFDLRKLGAGAEIDVTDDAGTVRRFMVSERFQVGKRALPVDELFRPDGTPVLTLITCGGGFDERHRTYDDNIVIRATPMPA